MERGRIRMKGREEEGEGEEGKRGKGGREWERSERERGEGKNGGRDKERGVKGESGVGSIIFWNVAGLKGKDEEFGQFIKKHDVIYLLETWIEIVEWERMRSVMPKGWE